MFLISFGRSIVFALQSFWRNIWLSLATIFIIFLAFLSINAMITINAISESALATVKDKIDVSVYFKPDASEDKIAEIKTHLAALPAVKEIAYHSAEENLANFKSRHQSDAVINETLDELAGNPMGATLVLKAKTLDDYPEILKAVDNPAYAPLIEEKNYNDNQLVISRINAISGSVREGGYIISLIFIIIAVLIVFNTVRIAIFTHQNEVNIMKLVGADNWFIRAPFVLENILSGVIACLLSLAVIYGILTVLQPHLNNFFQGLNFSLVDYFNAHIFLIFGAELLGVVILNTVASCLAVGRYLKV